MIKKGFGMIYVYNYQPWYDSNMWYDVKNKKWVTVFDVEINKNKKYNCCYFVKSLKAARRYYRKHKEELKNFDVSIIIYNKNKGSEFMLSKNKRYKNYEEENEFRDKYGEEACLRKYHPEYLDSYLKSEGR